MHLNNLETNAMYTSLKLEGVDSNMLAGLRKHLEAVQKIATEHQQKVARINSSPDFTAEGKKRQIVELEEGTRDRLERVRAAASGYADHLAQLQKQLTPKTRDGDAVLQHLQEREIRDRLNDMDQLLLQEMYTTAAQEGNDDLLMYAVEGAPASFALLPPDVLDKGKQLRAERQSPEAAGKLKELLRVRNALDDAIASAQSGLGAADDALSRVANGEV